MFGLVGLGGDEVVNMTLEGIVILFGFLAGSDGGGGAGGAVLGARERREGEEAKGGKKANSFHVPKIGLRGWECKRLFERLLERGFSVLS